MASLVRWTTHLQRRLGAGLRMIVGAGAHGRLGAVHRGQVAAQDERLLPTHGSRFVPSPKLHFQRVGGAGLRRPDMTGL